MSTIKLICDICHIEFEKEKKEYNRRIRLGKKEFYCSMSCSGKSENNLTHIKKVKSDFPIWEHSNKAEDEFSPFRPVLNRIRTRSRVNTNKDYDLTLQDLKDLWEDQDGKCPFTGFRLDLRTYKENLKVPLTIEVASLDRIDNHLGYIKGNVRWVSVMFNMARNTFSDEDVIRFSEAVATHGGKIESTGCTN